MPTRREKKIEQLRTTIGEKREEWEQNEGTYKGDAALKALTAARRRLKRLGASEDAD